MNLTPEQAHYVLNNLISEGKVRRSQVDKTLRGREREIKTLRERLASLERLGGSARASRDSSGPPKRVRRRRMSPKVRALRRLQGKYMGFVRRLKPAEKARIRAIREKQGIEAAIRVAASLNAKSS